MDMSDCFDFPFTINKTYRNSATHPVTIPKRHYTSLKRHMRGDRVDVTILGAGRRISGSIYRGCAGFGEYYQLRMSNHDFTKLPASCVKGRTLDVHFECAGQSIKVHLCPVA